MIPSNYENKVLELVNEARRGEGEPPLKLNEHLCTAAMGHAEDMGNKDFFSHSGSEDTSAVDRAIAAGYGSRAVGENIAAGQCTPEDVVKGWLDSPGHKKNIMGDYQHMGIALYYIPLGQDKGKVNYNWYWCQLFGRLV